MPVDSTTEAAVGAILGYLTLACVLAGVAIVLLQRAKRGVRRDSLFDDGYADRIPTGYFCAGQEVHLPAPRAMDRENFKQSHAPVHRATAVPFAASRRAS